MPTSPTTWGKWRTPPGSTIVSGGHLRTGSPRRGQLIEPLTNGIAAMKADPGKFIALEPENKWGTYDRFVPWLERLLEACIENPESEI